jgi:hypothetical protein
MRIAILVFSLTWLFNSSSSYAQDTPDLTSCKMYLNGAEVKETTQEQILEWCKLVPPTVMCNDGRVYQLERFKISFLTLNPFMNTSYGVGERGMPILAVRAIEKGQPGDALILKEVIYIDETGTENELPVISFKLK